MKAKFSISIFQSIGSRSVKTVGTICDKLKKNSQKHTLTVRDATREPPRFVSKRRCCRRRIVDDDVIAIRAYKTRRSRAQRLHSSAETRPVHTHARTHTARTITAPAHTRHLRLLSSCRRYYIVFVWFVVNTHCD